jgi:hypothetical protein
VRGSGVDVGSTSWGSLVRASTAHLRNAEAIVDVSREHYVDIELEALAMMKRE